MKKYIIKNGSLYITKNDYATVHRDYKGGTQSNPTMMAINPETGGTALFPVVFCEINKNKA